MNYQIKNKLLKCRLMKEEIMKEQKENKILIFQNIKINI